MGSARVNVNYLKKCKSDNKKITMLTCYDYSFAKLLDRCGVEILLVGDSLGMVIQGKDSTVPVTLEDMKYHTRCVAAGTENALVLTDLSFGTYEKSKEDAFHSAAELMRSGANMVKLEGGKEMAETVKFLQERGIPVCGHIGLTPQSVNTLGGYKVQGKDEASSQKLINDAKALDLANASMIVLECIPSKLAKEITATVSCPTIGIGAGADCDGQVLVLQDMLGLTEGKTAKFVKNFMKTSSNIEEAVTSYVTEVREGTYPSLQYSY